MKQLIPAKYPHTSMRISLNRKHLVLMSLETKAVSKQLKISVHTFWDWLMHNIEQNPLYKSKYGCTLIAGKSYLSGSEISDGNGSRPILPAEPSFLDQNGQVFAMYYAVRSTYYVVRTTFIRPKKYKAGFRPKQEMFLPFFYKTMLSYSVIHIINNIAQRTNATTKKKQQTTSNKPLLSVFPLEIMYYVLHTTYCVLRSTGRKSCTKPPVCGLMRS